MDITERQIRENIVSNQEWLEKTLVIVFENQTSDEQEKRVTRYYNEKGFNRNDARFMSSLALQILRNDHSLPLGERLTYKQVAALRGGNRVAKYAKQVLQYLISNNTQSAT